MTKPAAKNTNTPAPQGGVSSTELVLKMAKEQLIDPQAYASTVMKSCFDIKGPNKEPMQPTPEQFTAFLMIANEHGLNPITREIYAFAKGGKVVPIVSIDGWLKIINEHPQFDGMRFVDNIDDVGNLVSITCQIYRKDRKLPTEVTEYLDECRMPTEPWRKWEARMLRHKATIQGARYAFGFSGIVDPDEAERIRTADSIDGVATIIPDEPPQSAARRITNKIKDKAQETDLMPETENPEPTEVKPEIVDTDEIALDEIPGLKKASEIHSAELTDGQEEFIRDMEK